MTGGPGGRSRPGLVFYIPLFTALITLVLLTLAVSNGWLGQSMQVGTGFGEASRPGPIKQPANTFSSLAFVLSGLMMGWRLRRGTGEHPANPLTERTTFSGFFASLVVCLGPGSGAMHATESWIGGHLDMLSMYLVVAFLTAYAVQRFFGLQGVWFKLLFGMVAIFCVYVQDFDAPLPVLGDFGEFVFGFFLTVAIVLEVLNVFVRKITLDLKWGGLTLVFLVAAYLIWHLSLGNRQSYSVIQGHAVWHVLCAVSVYCLFRYYVSERGCPVRVQERTGEMEPLMNACAIQNGKPLMNADGR